MSDKSKIGWTDATWNPVSGCGWTSKPWTATHAAENVRLHPERLDHPLHWKKPRRIFVNSMSDLFHDQVPDTFLHHVFGAMALCYDPVIVDTNRVIRGYRSRHVFQILTKRPERMRQYLTALQAWGSKAEPEAFRSPFAAAVQAVSRAAGHPVGMNAPVLAYRWVQAGMPGLWLGVSVEDQRRADERIPVLQTTPATVRFLSCEPLLGPLNLAAYMSHHPVFDPTQPYFCARCGHLPSWHGTDIGWLDWIIVGAESGPGARPMDDDWVRSLRDQCVAANVPFFFKQRVHQGKKEVDPILDGRQWMEYPSDSPLQESD